MPRALPVVCEAYLEDGDENDTTRLVDMTADHNKNKMMAKLHGMNLNERDEVIDALISQENF
jgi:hypothetical protein